MGHPPAVTISCRKESFLGLTATVNRFFILIFFRLTVKLLSPRKDWAADEMITCWMTSNYYRHHFFFRFDFLSTCLYLLKSKMKKNMCAGVDVIPHPASFHQLMINSFSDWLSTADEKEQDVDADDRFLEMTVTGRSNHELLVTVTTSHNVIKKRLSAWRPTYSSYELITFSHYLSNH